MSDDHRVGGRTPSPGEPIVPRSRFEPGNPRKGILQSRREKVAAEIERNRRGEYRVPTWILTVALVVIIAGLILVFTLF